jgi:hypothetical protein
MLTKYEARAAKKKERNLRIRGIVQLLMSYNIRTSKCIEEVANEYSLSADTVYRIYVNTPNASPCDFATDKANSILHRMSLKPVRGK